MLLADPLGAAEVGDGRLAHSTLSAEKAERLADAIANYREIRRLLVL